MTRYTLSLTCALLCSSAFADVTPANLPYLHGTPLTDVNASGSYEWQVLDYQQRDADDLEWVWLQNDIGDNAYLLYPPKGETEAFALPIGESVDREIGRLKLALWGEELNLTFTPLGGEVAINGTYIVADLPAASMPAGVYDLAFSLTSINSIQVKGSRTAPEDNAEEPFEPVHLSTDGEITSVTGGTATDSFEGLDTDSTWLIGVPLGGDCVQPGDPTCVSYSTDASKADIDLSSIEIFIAGGTTDSFTFSGEAHGSIGTSGTAALTRSENAPASGADVACVTESSGVIISSALDGAQCTYAGSELLLSSDTDSLRITGELVTIDTDSAQIIYSESGLIPAAPLEPAPAGEENRQKKGGASYWLLLVALSAFGIVKRCSFGWRRQKK